MDMRKTPELYFNDNAVLATVKKATKNNIRPIVDFCIPVCLDVPAPLQGYYIEQLIRYAFNSNFNYKVYLDGTKEQITQWKDHEDNKELCNKESKNIISLIEYRNEDVWKEASQDFETWRNSDRKKELAQKALKSDLDSTKNRTDLKEKIMAKIGNDANGVIGDNTKTKEVRFTEEITLHTEETAKDVISWIRKQPNSETPHVCVLAYAHTLTQTMHHINKDIHNWNKEYRLPAYQDCCFTQLKFTTEAKLENRNQANAIPIAITRTSPKKKNSKGHSSSSESHSPPSSDSSLSEKEILGIIVDKTVSTLVREGKTMVEVGQAVSSFAKGLREEQLVKNPQPSTTATKGLQAVGLFQPPVKRRLFDDEESKDDSKKVSLLGIGKTHSSGSDD